MNRCINTTKHIYVYLTIYLSRSIHLYPHLHVRNRDIEVLGRVRMPDKAHVGHEKDAQVALKRRKRKKKIISYYSKTKLVLCGVVLLVCLCVCLVSRLTDS